MRSLIITLIALFASIAGPAVAVAQASPAYYVKVDQRWYAVTGGTVAVDGGGNLVDVPGTVLQTSCRRSNGALPDMGTHTALLGSVIFDVLYSNSAILLHPTTPPVVEIRTPSGDVSCGTGVTPPQTVIDAVNNPRHRGLQPLFSNGFEP
jgi:hypothetical protein